MLNHLKKKKTEIDAQEIQGLHSQIASLEIDKNVP